MRINNRLKDDTFTHIPYLFEQLSDTWPEGE